MHSAVIPANRSQRRITCRGSEIAAASMIPPANKMQNISGT
jgi:hypothetical protein